MSTTAREGTHPHQEFSGLLWLGRLLLRGVAYVALVLGVTYLGFAAYVISTSQLQDSNAAGTVSNIKYIGDPESPQQAIVTLALQYENQPLEIELTLVEQEAKAVRLNDVVRLSLTQTDPPEGEVLFSGHHLLRAYGSALLIAVATIACCMAILFWTKRPKRTLQEPSQA